MHNDQSFIRSLDQEQTLVNWMCCLQTSMKLIKKKEKNEFKIFRNASVVWKLNIFARWLGCLFTVYDMLQKSILRAGRRQARRVGMGDREWNNHGGKIAETISFKRKQAFSHMPDSFGLQVNVQCLMHATALVQCCSIFVSTASIDWFDAWNFLMHTRWNTLGCCTDALHAPTTKKSFYIVFGCVAILCGTFFDGTTIKTISQTRIKIQNKIEWSVQCTQQNRQHFNFKP